MPDGSTLSALPAGPGAPERFSKIPTTINQDLAPHEADVWVRDYLHHPIYLLGEAITRLRGDQPGFDANALDDLLPMDGSRYQVQWMKWLADRHLASLEGRKRDRMRQFYVGLFDQLATATLRPMPAGWEDRE